MFRIMLQKLLSKKWMNFCLLLGSVLLIATVVSFPIYQRAAYDRMIQDEFVNYLTSEGKWPAMNLLKFVSNKEPGGATITRMEGMMETIDSQLGVTGREKIYYYWMSKQDAHSTMNRKDLQDLGVRIGMLTDLPEHAAVLAGEMYSETGRTEDGAVEVVLSQASFVNLKLLVGETIELDYISDEDGSPLRLYVKGVFGAQDSSDFYWQVKPDSMDNICLMRPELFKALFTGEQARKYTISCYYYQLFEYDDIDVERADTLYANTVYFTEEGPYRGVVSTPDYRAILESYQGKRDRIRATLMILQIPVLVMLGAFLFMISGQMYDMERNEISVIKSRGSSGMQIFRLYLYQCTFLTLLGGAGGIPLGALFSRVLGSARNFLEFDLNSSMKITYTKEVLYYALAAMLVSLMVMTLPAIKHSRVTIVNLKQQKALKKKSWWEKVFLDVILLGVSLYGYYSFHRNSASLGESVMKGETLDPLLYISSSVFIVGAGLLFLRLQPYLVQLIYLIGKKFWKPASYASFMENLKNGRKQQFIMLFLIMTISLGMYHATVARTILQNARQNIEYLDGADIIIKERWDSVVDRNGVFTGSYYEPNYRKYYGAEFAKSHTRVLYDENAYIGTGRNDRLSITLMGIHTKEFGEMTWVDGSLLGRHYYEYLNDLAADPKGILVSENFATKQGHKLGDKITYYNERKIGVEGTIIGFVKYWPGYSPTITRVGPDGEAVTEENYLLISRFDYLRQKLGVQPYEVWISVKDGYTSRDVYQWVEDNKLKVRKYVDKQADIRNTLEDPLLQGTNGVLTMGFIVTILLCAVGYLIYWIMSIKSREMIFGVLRACGMHKGELFHMLMNEQIFSGVFSVFAGIGIGKLTSYMFAPMLQQAYAATNQVLPMQLITNQADMVRLYSVIAAVMVICLLILIILAFKLNVAKALKLGEE